MQGGTGRAYQYFHESFHGKFQRLIELCFQVKFWIFQKQIHIYFEFYFRCPFKKVREKVKKTSLIFFDFRESIEWWTCQSPRNIFRLFQGRFFHPAESISGSKTTCWGKLGKTKNLFEFTRGHCMDLTMTTKCSNSTIIRKSCKTYRGNEIYWRFDWFTRKINESLHFCLLEIL